MNRLTAVVAVLLLVSIGTAALAETEKGQTEFVTCPEGLMMSAHEHLLSLQEIQYATRDATLEEPVGIEEAAIFNQELHACHSGPGQHFRIFGEPRCLAADDDGTVNVRYSFSLQYRAATTMEQLFAAPWKEGTDGIWQVQFALRPEGWVAIGEKEVLDLSGKAPGHGAGKP